MYADASGHLDGDIQAFVAVHHVLSATTPKLI